MLLSVRFPGVKRQISSCGRLLKSAVSFWTETLLQRPQRHQGGMRDRMCKNLSLDRGRVGYYGREGFETVSCPFRKPLIQKTEENRGVGSRVRTKLHSIRQGFLSIGQFVGRGV